VCLSPVSAALKNGTFAKHGLDVELVNYSGSTDQLLEAISTGKSDAGVGMALRWLKPLEQGFDVKITAGTHGGCMRLLAAADSGITGLDGLKGKTIAVADLGSPAKNFFSILLAKQGIDPNRDVEWKVFPGDLLGLAIQKGEAQALADGDPNVWQIQKSANLVELATNLTGEYRNRSCCVLGVRGSLIRDDRPTATALTRALLEAAEWTAGHPDEAAAIFAPYAKATPAELSAMLQSQTHHHHPAGAELKQELALYTDDLKKVAVMKASTDPARFADKIFADVLT
jgi:NitT/TauT family transport system substrate-binding protein